MESLTAQPPDGRVHLRLVPPLPPQPPQALSRDVMRSRRKRAVRARTENFARMRNAAREALLQDVATIEEYDRPRTRAECPVERPCPFVSCRYHLYLDVGSKGALKLNFPDIEPDEMTHSCSLDVATLGGLNIETIGELMNLTRERVRQLEILARERIRHRVPESFLLGLLEGLTETRESSGVGVTDYADSR